MRSLTKLRSISLVLCGSLLFAGSAPVFAQRAGGHLGGFHGGGFHGGGFRGGYGGHYYGGYRGGYGYRGYGYGYGGWGWGLGGLGLGLYFASLPYYYSTYWWGGVPYYYADNNYYRWNAGVSQYETVAPPAEVENQAGSGVLGSTGGGTGGSELFAYPKNGQSQEQQGKDKYECHHWPLVSQDLIPAKAQAPVLFLGAATTCARRPLASRAAATPCADFGPPAAARAAPIH